jgi:hypothetical protein
MQGYQYPAQHTVRPGTVVRISTVCNMYHVCSQQEEVRYRSGGRQHTTSSLHDPLRTSWRTHNPVVISYPWPCMDRNQAARLKAAKQTSLCISTDVWQGDTYHTNRTNRGPAQISEAITVNSRWPVHQAEDAGNTDVCAVEQRNYILAARAPGAQADKH